MFIHELMKACFNLRQPQSEKSTNIYMVVRMNKKQVQPASSIEEKIKLYRRQGHIVPPRKIIKNAEQIDRKSVV